VTLITGFLGSGKTTLINRLLRSPSLGDAAVIVNEFGEIGIDNALIEKVDGNIALLDSGCVCCTVRNDLVDTMQDLLARVATGAVPPFARLVIETTGLADPAPIVRTLMTDPQVATQYSLGSVVTVVDVINGASTLERHPEAARQTAMADSIVLSKADLLEGPVSPELERALAQLNPAATVFGSVELAADATRMLIPGLYSPSTKSADVRKWLRLAAYADIAGGEHAAHGQAQGDGHHHGHTSGIDTFSICSEEPLSWPQLGRFLELLGGLAGDDLLRVKGLVNVEGLDGPAVVHGVQRLIHVPTLLPAWPDEDRRTRIVFVTRDIERERIPSMFRMASASNGLP
jgi:G3E family GTPase